MQLKSQTCLPHQDLQPTERHKVGNAVDERPIYIGKYLIQIETLLSELIGIYSRPPRLLLYTALLHKIHSRIGILIVFTIVRPKCVYFVH